MTGLVMALVLGSLCIGAFVGLWVAVWVHARQDQPLPPTRVQRLRKRSARHREFKTRRREFARDGFLPPARPAREVTW